MFSVVSSIDSLKCVDEDSSNNVDVSETPTAMLRDSAVDSMRATDSLAPPTRGDVDLSSSPLVPRVRNVDRIEGTFVLARRVRPNRWSSPEPDDDPDVVGGGDGVSVPRSFGDESCTAGDSSASLWKVFSSDDGGICRGGEPGVNAPKIGPSRSTTAGESSARPRRRGGVPILRRGGVAGMWVLSDADPAREELASNNSAASSMMDSVPDAGAGIGDSPCTGDASNVGVIALIVLRLCDGGVPNESLIPGVAGA